MRHRPVSHAIYENAIYENGQLSCIYGGFYTTASGRFTAGNSYLHETEAVVNGPITCGRVNATKLYKSGDTYPTEFRLTNSGYHIDCYINYWTGHEFQINYYANTQVVLNRVGGYSDRRIKENIQDIKDDEALQKIRALQPKTYTYKTEPERGVVYGFIAQEVKEVLPHAVSLMRCVAPFDTMINANLTSNVLTLECPCDVLEVGKDIQLKRPNRRELADITITNKISDTEYEVNRSRINEDGGDGEYLLVGQEVDDFHTLDKNAVFVVATSAIQELDRQLQAERARNDELQVRLQALEARIEALE